MAVSPNVTPVKTRPMAARDSKLEEEVFQSYSIDFVVALLTGWAVVTAETIHPSYHLLPLIAHSQPQFSDYGHTCNRTGLCCVRRVSR